MMQKLSLCICVAAMCLVGSAAQVAVMANVDKEEVKVVSLWEQCGGSSCPYREGCADAPWPTARCAQGMKCERESEYYWQCRSVAKLYEQCGGKSCGNRGACGDRAWAACLQGTCSRANEYYWQCTGQQASTAAAKPAAKIVAKTAAKPAAKKPQGKPATSAAVSVAAVHDKQARPDTAAQKGTNAQHQQRVAELEQWAASVAEKNMVSAAAAARTQ